jgi:hypothetical protein
VAVKFKKLPESVHFQTGFQFDFRGFCGSQGFLTSKKLAALGGRRVINAFRTELQFDNVQHCESAGHDGNLPRRQMKGARSCG